MRAKEFMADKKTLVSAIKKFLPLAKKCLEIEALPKIVLKKHLSKDHQPTFGRFINHNQIIEIGIENRQPVDILRTLAHELTHYKQWTKNQLEKDSGKTGSPEENQAHIKAGILLRLFNKKYPEYLKKEPIDIDESKKPFRKSFKQASSNFHTYDYLDNNSHPYMAYRFGVALAGSPDFIMDREGPVGSKFSIIDYTEADSAIRKGAEKVIGVKSSSTTGKGSEELDTTNTDSLINDKLRNKK